MKTYQLCYAQASAVEAKFRVSETAKGKFEESHPTKVGSSRKYKVLEKDFDKVGFLVQVVWEVVFHSSFDLT